MTATWTTPKTWSSALVTSTDMNTHIRDNMDYLAARPLLDVADDDGTVSNTTSATFADITGASGSFTSSTTRALCLATISFGPVAPNTAYFTFSVNGTDVGDATNGLGRNPNGSGGGQTMMLLYVATGLTAGATITIKLRYKTSGGTLTVTQFRMTVIEY